MKRESSSDTNILLVTIIAIVVIFITSCLTGCNKQIIDLTYSYNYAIIQLPDGTIKEGKIASWSDYDGEQLQVKFKDGTVHLTSSYRCELINQ